MSRLNAPRGCSGFCLSKCCCRKAEGGWEHLAQLHTASLSPADDKLALRSAVAVQRGRCWFRSAPSLPLSSSSSSHSSSSSLYLPLSLSLSPPTHRSTLAAILRRTNPIMSWREGSSLVTWAEPAAASAARPGDRTQAGGRAGTHVRPKWWRGKAWMKTSRSAGREYRSQSRPSCGGKPG